MMPTKFDFESGALCLDFANTVNWHASDHPEDGLMGYADLARWGEAAGMLTPGKAEQLIQSGEEEPESAAESLARAVKLREAIYRIFASISDGAPTSQDDLKILNLALSQSLSHLQITHSAEGFAWSWEQASTRIDQIEWAVARSAAELLTSKKLTRTRNCADDRGCGYLFIDTSRNRSRRWCSMGSCGNRAKARRHYQNQ